jgi:hypothetical protein
MKKNLYSGIPAGSVALLVMSCMHGDVDHLMKGFMLGLLTGKDVPVSPLHIFTLSVHSKTD